MVYCHKGGLRMWVCLALAAYLAAVAWYRARATADRGTIWKILGYELCVCAVLAALAVGRGWLRWLAAACLLPVAAVLVRILFHMFDRSSGEVENVIVLGMALENGRPNRDLIYRLDAALRCVPGGKYIVTGGNAGAGRESEAAVMQRYLIKHGVPENKILVEDRAVDTPANFRNVADMIDVSKPVTLVTSGYHMLRARGIAKRAGFHNLSGYSAKCDWRFLIANIAWEIVCELGEVKKRL